jgi:predicted RNA-binding protein with PIN domain
MPHEAMQRYPSLPLVPATPFFAFRNKRCRLLTHGANTGVINAVSNNRYLLIDAHNVIYARADLRAALHGGNPDSARDQLAAMVSSIHDAEGIRTALILDSRNAALRVDHPFGHDTFELIYAPADVSADGIIERIVARVPNPGDVSVVSNDNMVRESIRASGANALTPDELFEWARGCDARLIQDVQRRRTANAREWKNGLNVEL